MWYNPLRSRAPLPLHLPNDASRFNLAKEPEPPIGGKLGAQLPLKFRLHWLTSDIGHAQKEEFSGRKGGSGDDCYGCSRGHDY